METLILLVVDMTVYNLTRKSIRLPLGTVWPSKHKTQTENKTLEAASKKQ
jgi:hypothetical protein